MSKISGEKIANEIVTFINGESTESDILPYLK